MFRLVPVHIVSNNNSRYQIPLTWSCRWPSLLAFQLVKPLLVQDLCTLLLPFVMPMVITTCVLFSPRPCASSADARFSSTCPLISLPAKTRAFSDLKSLHTLWLDSLFLLLPRGGNCVYDWLHLLSNLFTCFCRRKSATWNKNHGTEFSIRTYSFQRTSIVYLI